MHKAMFQRTFRGAIKCGLCQRGCVIANNSVGFCGVRKNVNGVLQSLNYGKLISASVDPIEKKPLYHFYPGTKTFSVAAVGCSLACKFCQNSEISREFKDVVGQDVSPKQLAELAINEKTSKGVSWTYTEPTVFFEYFYDTMKFIRKQHPDQFSVWVTNGYTTPTAIKKAQPFVDAVNVDYKGPDEFYKKLCFADLDKVQLALKEWKKTGAHIEVTNLIIPGMNDSKDNIIQMCSWLQENLGNVPLHLSAYHPYYKMLELTPVPESTPIETLEMAHKVASDYLDYVYIGNVESDKNNTYCPQCNSLLIIRNGFSSSLFGLDGNKCKNCGHVIPLKI